jgi:hypothetical protein
VTRPPPQNLPKPPNLPQNPPHAPHPPPPQVPPELFSESFAFRDESVATTGVRSYALGVRKLFDQETARAELITVTVGDASPSGNGGGGGSITAVWRLQGRVNLPGRPTIPPYVVTTRLEVDASGLICGQVDEFDAPGWKLLAGALLGPWAGPPPAPPADELRAAAAAAGRPSVVRPGAGARKRAG